MFIVDFNNSNQCHFPSGFIAHKNSEVMLVDDVLGLLDEVKQQIPSIVNDVKTRVGTKIDLEKSTPKAVWDVVFSMINDRFVSVLDGKAK
jgi:hypothetical protein